jgi:hypothetical protein
MSSEFNREFFPRKQQEYFPELLLFLTLIIKEIKGLRDLGI